MVILTRLAAIFGCNEVHVLDIIAARFDVIVNGIWCNCNDNVPLE